MSNYLIEVVSSSVHSSIEAERGGAGRIELCSALNTAGISPSTGMLEMVKKHITIPVFVMLRPREGDFVYSSLELDVMKREIDLAAQSGADGFVLGILDKHGRVNFDHTQELVQYCSPLPVTFHRAFDCTPYLQEALEAVISTGCTRILTSGGQATALAGIEAIVELHQAARGRIIIMPGGGIRPDLLPHIFHPEIKEYHMSGRIPIAPKMDSSLFEMNYFETDASIIRQCSQWMKARS